MPNAIITESRSSNTFTYSELISQLKSALIDAGFPATIHDDRSGINQAENSIYKDYWIYKIPVDSDQTKARAFIYYEVGLQINTSNQCRILTRWFYNWNLTTHKGTCVTYEIVDSGILIPLANTTQSQVVMYAIRHPEVKQVTLNYRDSWGQLNFLAPSQIVSGWGFDNINYSPVFQGSIDYNILRQPGYTYFDYATNAANVSQAALQPNPMKPMEQGNGTLSNGGRYAINFWNISIKTERNLKYQLIPNPIVQTSTGEGIVAYFSGDVAAVAANALPWMTKFTDGTKNFLLLAPKNNGALAIAIN